MYKKQLTGSMTIEASFLIPIVFMILMELIFTFFFMHDKNLLHGTAYEAVVVGSTKMREKEKITEQELIAYCQERLKQKCIFLTYQQIKVSIDEKEIRVQITASKGRKSIEVEKRMPVTNPEERIRDIKRLELENGT